MIEPHAHLCPRCGRHFEHVRFVYASDWNGLQRIVARALHRFYGACAPCMRKFMKNDFGQDAEIQNLRTVQTSAGVVFSQLLPNLQEKTSAGAD